MKLPMNLSSRLSRSRKSFSEFWAALEMRERRMLIVAAFVAILGLSYALLIDPALSDRAKLDRNMPELRQQVAQLQALAQEAAMYSAKPSIPITAMPVESIRAALEAKGLKPQNVMQSGDLVKVQLSAASFAGMLGWIDEMQKAARLSIIEANIVVLDKPDTVNAALTLRQPRGE